MRKLALTYLGLVLTSAALFLAAASPALSQEPAPAAQEAPDVEQLRLAIFQPETAPAPPAEAPGGLPDALPATDGCCVQAGYDCRLYCKALCGGACYAISNCNGITCEATCECCPW